MHIAMASMIKIIIDCFGGDHSPEANVDGAVAALARIVVCRIVARAVLEERAVFHRAAFFFVLVAESDDRVP